jgi:hypothetical protein
VITVPSGGLATTSSLYFGTIAAQVEVTAGPVTINNITVDGTASGSTCPSVYYAAIFYSSGSSGTVNEVETRNQNCNGLGLGIVAENGAGASQTVTIENSNIHDNNAYGISAYSNQTPPTLTISIKRNHVASNGHGIFLYGSVAGSASGNTIDAGDQGVFAGSASSSVLGNTVTALFSGVYVAAAAVISGNTVINGNIGIDVDPSAAGSKVMTNHVLNSSVHGIEVATGGATISNNIITKAGSVGIEFNCNTDTVSGNTINGAPTGIDMVPATFNGVNHFYNVATVKTGGC